MFSSLKKKKAQGDKSAGEAGGDAARIEHKKSKAYAWFSVAFGVLLMLVWAWFVVNNGFQSLLAPIDLSPRQPPGVTDRQTEDLPADRRQPAKDARQSNSGVTDKKETGGARENASQPWQHLEAAVSRHEQTIKGMELQIQRLRLRLSELDKTLQEKAQRALSDITPMLALALSEADLLVRAGQFDGARHYFKQAEKLLPSWQAAGERDKNQLADAVAEDIQSVDRLYAGDSIHEEIDKVLIQLIAKPETTSPRQTTAQQADSYYQKAALWLKERLSRGITIRHHHFPQLQGEDRVNLIHSLLLAQRAVGRYKPAAYQSAINNAIGICRQTGADSLLNQLQELAALELPPPYMGKAIRRFIELNRRDGK